jgi:hypothetical protein
MKVQYQLAALAAAALFASPAMAQYNGNGGACGFGATCDGGMGQDQGQAQGQLQGQAQGQLQGQGQAQGQIGINKNLNQNNVGNGFGNFSPKSSSSSRSYSNSKANAGAFSGGNKQTMIYKEAEIPTETTNHVDYSGSYNVKTNPPVFAPSINPTSPCMGSTVVGGSGGLIGLTIGSSWKDDDCGYRETARMFHEIGLQKDAIAVLCASEYAKSAPACGGGAAAKTAAAATPAPQAQATSKPEKVARTDNTPAKALVASKDGRLWKQDGYGEWVQVSY